MVAAMVALRGHVVVYDQNPVELMVILLYEKKYSKMYLVTQECVLN